MTIQQSGVVTPGHLAQWVTDGVLADAGANPYSNRVLATLLNADFADTGDQPIPLPPRLNAFQLTGIVIARANQSLSAAVGGFYPQASKAGSPIVAAAQTYSALTTSLLLMNATLTAYAISQCFQRVQLPDWAIYFSLTTAQPTPALANIYLTGIELS